MKVTKVNPDQGLNLSPNQPLNQPLNHRNHNQKIDLKMEDLKIHLDHKVNLKMSIFINSINRKKK